MKKLLLAASVLALGSVSALAADLSPRMYSKAPVAIDPGYDWSGFYIGGNAGYSWGRATTDVTGSGTTSTTVFRTANGGPGGVGDVTTTAVIPATALPGGRSNVDGFIGGGQIGYNWQRSQWLFGLETDFQGSGERGSFSACGVAGCPAGSTITSADTRLDWFGTARGRIGYLPSQRVVLYGTGGLAYGALRTNVTNGVVGIGTGTSSTDDTRVGWTIGAGAEAALDQNWSVKLEYLYVDLGRFNNAGASASSTATVANVPTQGFSTATTTTLVGTASTRFTDNIVRIGVNYRWGGPVVAKY
jgi:outer membrane immunogenic protein